MGKLLLTLLTYISWVSPLALACNTEEALILTGKIKNSAQVKAEKVVLSVVPGSKIKESKKLKVEMIKPEPMGAPGGLFLYSVKAQGNPLDGAKDTLEVTSPKGKMIKVNVEILPTTKRCTQPEVKYN
jgi:hypothetical protein